MRKAFSSAPLTLAIFLLAAAGAPARAEGTNHVTVILQGTLVKTSGPSIVITATGETGVVVPKSGTPHPMALHELVPRLRKGLTREGAKTGTLAGVAANGKSAETLRLKIVSIGHSGRLVQIAFDATEFARSRSFVEQLNGRQIVYSVGDVDLER